MTKADRAVLPLSTLTNVRHSGGALPAEVRASRYSDRLVVHIPTECGYSFVELDLADLVGWLRSGPAAVAIRMALKHGLSNV